MAFIPIENLGGGSAFAKFLYLVQDGVLKDTYATTVGGIATSAYNGFLKILGTANSYNGMRFNTTATSDKYACLVVEGYHGSTYSYSGGNFAIGVDTQSNITDAMLLDYSTEMTTSNATYSIQLNSGTNYAYFIVANNVRDFYIKNAYFLPYPKSLSDGELYAYGLGINDWDNTGYALASGGAWTNNGGFTINDKSISGTVPTLTNGGNTISIVYNNKIDLSRYSRVILTTNEGEMSADISSKTATLYLVICMWASGSERALRVCFSPNKNNFSNAGYEYDLKKISSYFSITITKVRLE